MANSNITTTPEATAIPQRLCISCRQLFPRTGLLRLLREYKTQQVLLFLPQQAPVKQFGRSTYLCPTPACIQQALKGKRLHKTLKTAVPDDIFNYLDSYLKGNNCSGIS